MRGRPLLHGVAAGGKRRREVELSASGGREDEPLGRLLEREERRGGELGKKSHRLSLLPSFLWPLSGFVFRRQASMAERERERVRKSRRGGF